MKKQALPIGIQSFSEIRKGDYLYVDKTEVIYQLTTTSKYFFLSRPRRFGKSLLISTLKSLYQGEKKLFEGLWVADQWDWDNTYSVIHIDFNNIGYQPIGLERAIEIELKAIAKSFQLTLEGEGTPLLFKELIEKLAVERQVVILIDEYDKPIIDNLSKTDLPKAYANRQILKSFYSVIKGNDDLIKFLLITGISKFSKVGIFSDLNNLADITFDWRFSDIVGCTQAEIDHYFQPYRALALERNQCTDEELTEQMREWYNGYTWDLRKYIYNPFSILSFFSRGDFSNFWFETGTPTFLINILKDRFYYDFSDAKVGGAAFLSYNIEKLDTLPLLFQTGYLTFKEQTGRIYVLDYPNNEVKASMLEHLIGAFRHGDTSSSGVVGYEMELAFIHNDMDNLITLINRLFATIPYQLFDAHKEKYYHALIHLMFQYIGIYMESEVNTSRGRVDTVVHTDTHIYIIEFKLDQSVDKAITQIKERGYADRYRNTSKQIIGLGINFNSKKKEIGDWRTVVL